ncbi:MAG: type IV pilus assembly protein PilM [Candidatus Beckwithbacteria bacterium]
MSFFGLDIGSTQIKVLQAEKSNHEFKVAKVAVVNSDPKNLAISIQQAVKEAGIRGAVEVNLALAESEVFTKIIETPQLTDTELASSIQFEAEQYIPIPLNEVELHHQVLGFREGENEKLMKVLLIAVPRTKIDSLMHLIDQAELIPKSLETELFSLKRVFGDESKTQAIVSFGYQTTDLMILNKGLSLFTYAINVGGGALTKSLMNELNLPVDQAEEYKKTYGVNKELMEGKVAKVLSPVIDEIVDQINKAVMFLQQQNFNKPIEELILTGGGGLLPGLGAYLTSKLNVEVVVGDPFTRFIKNNDFKQKIAAVSNPQLATVTGLALKGLI